MADASDSSVSTSASDRHALNFEAFSQTPPKKTAEGVQIAAAEKSEEQDDNGVLEDRARQISNSIPITHATLPSALFFHLCPKKGSKSSIVFPIRLPQEDEYIGYKSVLTIKDPDRQAVVKYVQFPHAEINGKDIGLFDVVPRSQLVPYYGKDDNADKSNWCPSLLGQYFKQMKQKHKKLGVMQIRIEELFLERVLQRALEEEESRKKLEAYSVAVEEKPAAFESSGGVAKSNTTKDTTNNSALENNDDESDQEPTNAPRRSKRRRSHNDSNTEWLHVGDLIKFYKPATAAGVPDNLRLATITSIHPKSDPALTIYCEQDFFVTVIPNDHHVIRVKRMERGKLVDNSGKKWRAVCDFVMKKEGSAEQAEREAGDRKRDWTNEILQRNKRQAVEAIERDGCGPADMLRKL